MPKKFTETYVPLFLYAGTGSTRSLKLAPTAAADAVAESNRQERSQKPAKSPEVVEEEARAACRGEISENLILSHTQLQFGKYRNQSFRWVLANDVGWAVGVVDSIDREADTGSMHPLYVNKRKFVQYARLFPAMVQELQYRESRDRALAHERTTGDTGKRLLEFGKYRQKTWCAVYESVDPEERRYVKQFILPKKNCIPGSKMAQFQHYCAGRRASETSLSQPPVQTQPESRPVEPTATESKTLESAEFKGDVDDESIVAAVAEYERGREAAADVGERCGAAAAGSGGHGLARLIGSGVCSLYKGWQKTMPTADQTWVMRHIFQPTPSGIEMKHPQRLWYYPPVPLHTYSQPPRSPDAFFATKLCYWAPYYMWKVLLRCPEKGCKGHPLTGSSRAYKHTVRQVLAFSGFYNLASEYLECTRCKKRYISWSDVVMDQLSLRHRSKFPALLTYRYACDKEVVTMTRERSLGNSLTQLYRKLTEQHRLDWLQRGVDYMSACEPFATRQPGVAFPEPPPQPDIPLPTWMVSVYLRDVMTRIDDIKAKLTSTFGSILKLDSTKKLTRKLSGGAALTAQWATDIGNEYGQVLTCVLTTSEGSGLEAMCQGLTSRYRDAQIDPPKVLYVDRDCCGPAAGHLFPDWSDLQARLDIWHLMRRLARGVTTTSHQLYGEFMSKLSACIFEWDKQDLDALCQAKGAEMGINEAGAHRFLTRKELALHCRRKTRGEEETTELIGQLIDGLRGDKGVDTLGVPLFDQDLMDNIWSLEKKHIGCIQDPVDVQLYTETGIAWKGGFQLKTYRCARGSVSLESFHLHITRFIPGTTASDAYFQALLLEGIARWNDDRSVAAVGGSPTKFRCFDDKLKAEHSRLSSKLWSQPIVDHRPPLPYTGELFGVEYLYRQTGRSLNLVTCDTDEELEVPPEVLEEITEEEFADVEDLTVGELKFLVEQHQLPAPSTSRQSESDDDTISSQEAVGPDGVPGYQAVQKLAQYLVKLDSVTFFTNRQVDRIVMLWNKLSETDRQRIVYTARHQTRLVAGRFRQAGKKRSFIVGTDSVRRVFLGHGVPAQKPGLNRLVDAICSQLHSKYRRQTVLRTAGGRLLVPKWQLILDKYANIQEVTMSSAGIRDRTDLQLFEINLHTLRQWHKQRIEGREKGTLLQGLNLPKPSMTAAASLPAARPLLTELPRHLTAEHTYALPVDTTGQAVGRRARVTPAPTSGVPAAHLAPTVTPDVKPDEEPGPSEPALPRTTEWRRRKREAEAAALGVPLPPAAEAKAPRKPYTCRQCGETGHSQYYGQRYCPQSGVPFDQWKASVTAARHARLAAEQISTDSTAGTE